jgi:2-amino-4-hydroxy-6-hydroxymethyldihydropteridine diphosphokinase
MKEVYLSLGGNLGDREKNLFLAIDLLKKENITITAISKIYETASWGINDQPDFLNLVIKIYSNLNAEELLEKILHIEKLMGRTREKKWGSRLIDIDIIAYGNEIYNSEKLKIPHPYLQERKFVLIPLKEIEPNWHHPILNKNIDELLSKCSDNCEVKILK